MKQQFFYFVFVIFSVVCEVYEPIKQIYSKLA